MKKINKTKICSICLLIIFSVFTFMVNFSFSVELQKQAQIQASIIQKEKYEISKIADTSNFVEKTDGYHIKTHYGFVQFMDSVNSGTPYTGSTILLDIDIDLNELVDGDGNKVSFVPIGHSSAFSGTFNGNKHTIKNLTITGNYDYCGLFGYVSGGTIREITLLINEISSSKGVGVGGIVGVLNNSIVAMCMVLPMQSTSKISLSSSGYIGGVVGLALSNCSIGMCANMVTVVNTPSNDYGTCVGGILGAFGNDSKYKTEVAQCYTGAQIKLTKTPLTSKTSAYVGGIVGGDNYTSNCTSTSLDVKYCINEAVFNISGNNATQQKTYTFNGDDYCGKVLTEYNFSYYACGGIVGYGSGDYTQITGCINYTDDKGASVIQSIYIKYDIEAVYGNNTSSEAIYYDYDRNANNFDGIGFNCKATSCVSVVYSWFNAVTISRNGRVYNRTYPKKYVGLETSLEPIDIVKGFDDPRWVAKFSQIPMSERLSEAKDGTLYIFTDDYDVLTDNETKEMYCTNVNNGTCCGEYVEHTRKSVIYTNCIYNEYNAPTVFYSWGLSGTIKNQEIYYPCLVGYVRAVDNSSLDEFPVWTYDTSYRGKTLYEQSRNPYKTSSSNSISYDGSNTFKIDDSGTTISLKNNSTTWYNGLSKAIPNIDTKYNPSYTSLEKTALTDINTTKLAEYCGGSSASYYAVPTGGVPTLVWMEWMLNGSQPTIK